MKAMNYPLRLYNSTFHLGSVFLPAAGNIFCGNIALAIKVGNKNFMPFICIKKMQIFVIGSIEVSKSGGYQLLFYLKERF